jgi:hypothetical protein
MSIASEAKIGTPVSTGNFSSLADNLSASEQLLTTVRELVCKRPPKCIWYAVCWDYDQCIFDISTIRQEPERGDDPTLFRQPFVFPWVYLPADADVPLPKQNGMDIPHAEPPGYTRVCQAVRHLNEHCHGMVGLTFGRNSQRNTEEIADIVSSVGGKLLRSVSNSAPPNTIPTPRFREPTTARVRSQPQRYTKSRRRGEQLADLADKPRNRIRCELREAIRQTRTKHRPVPLPVNNFVPWHEKHGFTEDETREWLGIETYADQIVKALGLE